METPRFEHLTSQMKFLLIFFLLSLTTLDCKNGLTNNLPTYNEFVFSYSTESENYSVKFVRNDTIFLQERFPKPKGLFYSVMRGNDREKLDSFLNKIHFSTYDTVYFQDNLHDGTSYKFYLKQATAINWVFIYGHNGPKLLYEFADWMATLKNRQIYHPSDASVTFGDLTYIVLPPIPPPTNNSR